eukprot:jgi/Psemu1/286277/fgenesh1_pg.128_\
MIVKGSTLSKAFGAETPHVEQQTASTAMDTATATATAPPVRLRVPVPVPCEKYLAPLARKKKIDLEAIGSRPNNQLLDLLRCRVAKIQTANAEDCRSLARAYASCHASVMGTGSFGGRKHCGAELSGYLDCVLAGAGAGAGEDAVSA